MSYSPSFAGWNSLTINDLLAAYRKAKTDCFFDNNFPTSAKFADYEENLLGNLENLLLRLKENQGFSSFSGIFGCYRLLPKKLAIVPNSNSKTNEGHVYFSDSTKAFSNLIKNNKIKPEFRVIGDFPM